MQFISIILRKDVRPEKLIRHAKEQIEFIKLSYKKI